MQYTYGYNIRHILGWRINWLRFGEAYIRQDAVPPLIQAMACRLFGAKPLPESMVTDDKPSPETTLIGCQLDPNKQTSIKFQSKLVSPEKAFENVVCREWRPSCSVLLTLQPPTITTARTDDEWVFVRSYILLVGIIAVMSCNDLFLGVSSPPRVVRTRGTDYYS